MSNSYENLLKKYRNHPNVRNIVNNRFDIQRSDKFRNDYKRVLLSNRGLQKRIMLNAMVNYTNASNSKQRNIKNIISKIGMVNNFNNALKQYKREILLPKLKQIHRNKEESNRIARMRANANNNNNNAPRTNNEGWHINYNSMCRGCNLGSSSNRLHCIACRRVRGLR